MKRHNSPCIDVCDFTGKNGWCLGCGRTKEECKNWKSLKPYARKKIEKELKKRLSKL